MPLYNADARLAAPIRLHTLTPSAESARVAVHEYKRHTRDASLVTKHPQPHAELVPTSAARLIAAAEHNGFEVRTSFGYWTLNPGKSNERKAEACRIEGLKLDERVGFQAVWVEGSAKLGLWREPHAEDVGVLGIKKRVGPAPRTPAKPRKPTIEGVS